MSDCLLLHLLSLETFQQLSPNEKCYICPSYESLHSYTTLAMKIQLPFGKGRRRPTSRGTLTSNAVTPLAV